MTLQQRIEMLPRRFWLTVAVFLLLAASFGVYVRAEKEIDRANEMRHRSFVLANQLQRSSDELTRMARTYVVTGDPRYKQFYQDILDIRDGRKPRPSGYMQPYWDFVLADIQAPPEAGGLTPSLLELMRQAGFTEDEQRLLTAAKAESDALARIEVEAMSRVDLAGPDLAARRAEANLMLHDVRYHQAKAAIMQPIKEFYGKLDLRTADGVFMAERSADAFRVLFVICFLGALLMVWKDYAALRVTLGGAAEEIHAQIRRIGRGDMTQAIVVAPGMADSVLAGLSVMQLRLKAIEAERQEADSTLRLSEQRFSTAFNSCPVAASIAAAEDGRFMEANANYERDFGWTRADLIGRTSVEVGLWPDQETREPWAQAIRREGRLVDYETVWMHKNGQRRNVSLSAEITELQGKICILAFATDITERTLAGAALVASETRLRSVLDGVQSGVITITQNGIVESFNLSAQRMFGYRADEVVGRNVNMLMPEPYRSAHDGYLAAYRHSGVRKVIGGSADVMGRRKDGSSFHLQLGITETLLNGRKLFIGSVTDISFRKEVEAELRIAATAFESQEGMVVTDARGMILRVNRAFTESTGYAADEVIGKTPQILKSGRHDREFYAAMWDSLIHTGGWQGEVWDRRKNGEVYPKWLTISAVKGEDGTVTHYIGTHLDITERKIAEERIRELAFFDSLTGLPNRILLMDRLKQAMTAGNRSGNLGAVLFIDLDNFKTLNDTLGHDMGDLLLRQVAQRLAGSVREGDTVARLGGDEFVVVLGSLNPGVDEAANQTEVVGEKILAALNQPYRLGEIDHRSTASIGVTLFRGHETSIDELLKQADLAMYKSKDTGRNALHFFDPAMQTVVVERAAMEAALREAIQGRQLLLHFQAQVAGAGRVTGAEVLVRWQNPQRGMVPPAEFIPLAEETGLIFDLGDQVLAGACEQLAKWAAQPDMAHLALAVNVSVQQFRDPDFVDRVLSIIGRSGADPGRLKLELTESLLAENVEDIIGKMFALKARGVGFSLDDFGTGYSSLSYLKRLPLDQLKIDRSFVRDVLADPNDAAIARTIVALARSLGLGVIAEGVETAMQRDFLAGSGCHAYQGYYFSRPLPIEGFEAYVRQASAPEV